MFRKRLGLAQLEQAVAEMEAGGVTPTRDTITVAAAICNAVGVPVTARQEAEAEIAVQQSAAQAARSRASLVRKQARARAEALQRQIEKVQQQGEAQVSELQRSANQSDARAGQVHNLLNLL
ncbi:MAG: hypothetical protein A2806_02060 [Candidatus Terrybacteria bacterium RIFCSPHIGHO2_01_FULL_48_17]|uniref:Uncharacterized protein n=1 Tax=Candidatus Terrybacteria bacterium RIFCSPHIGHO2_01_FULL_48_17 TaxID=1802362 RepID=A0A1G2PJK8_9BACT|nr:MAG: hypothetical protein A2806_02060 [Candidatus Terrybacteria bacterium RIFCSPHIGHO2_01_FULL_48_17]OHA53538.1 MAG: hypothetical protein A3A30_00015 [Candidatus Terrybacteria bacterium RIFCSPLOWO2_01_FULL_48_14]